MARFLTIRRPPRVDQREFGFVERSRRLQRRFKFGIAAATLLLVVGIVGGLSRGRFLVASAMDQARQTARWTVGLPVPREEIEARHERERRQGIENVGAAFRAAFPAMTEPIQRLFRYAGSDPDSGILRWGNFDQTFLLPSTVFQPDDSGRAYTLKPNTRSIWVRNVSPRGAPLTFLIVPDRPELPEVIKGSGGIIVEDSVQTTNSWGLRGPEPDLSAELKGIVLGDSFMQGLFIDDDHAPPECLRRYLERSEKASVSILNTGVLGHSPEQYYYSLRAFIDRFPPTFIVVSIFVNDFGSDAIQGDGDWDEGKYWLGEIQQVCRSRGVVLLTVPIPFADQLSGARKAGVYPGMVSNIYEGGSESYLDPTDQLVNRNMALILEGDRAGNRPLGSPLFNGAIGDGHFSATGAEAWAEVVGRRLVLLLDKAREVRRPRKPQSENQAAGP